MTAAASARHEAVMEVLKKMDEFQPLVGTYRLLKEWLQAELGKL